MITDPIANALTNIRNCVKVKKKNAQVVLNNTILGILNVLLDNGFINNFTVKTLENKSRIADVELKYNPDPAIVEIKRVSKPGRRIYSGCKNFPKIYNNLGISILSTNKGIISDKQARREKVGGELLCIAF
jgi:small subunit ribosomal protein S8